MEKWQKGFRGRVMYIYKCPISFGMVEVCGDSQRLGVSDTLIYSHFSLSQLLGPYSDYPHPFSLLTPLNDLSLNVTSQQPILN